jgi:hypothetical protein
MLAAAVSGQLKIMSLNNRSDCPQIYEHSIPLKDENAPPPKRKLYPLDGVELEELKT